jgi:hypothetical protein
MLRVPVLALKNRTAVIATAMLPMTNGFDP